MMNSPKIESESETDVLPGKLRDTPCVENPGTDPALAGAAIPIAKATTKIMHRMNTILFVKCQPGLIIAHLSQNALVGTFHRCWYPIFINPFR
jgi:hypothetical protein